MMARTMALATLWSMAWCAMGQTSPAPQADTQRPVLVLDAVQGAWSSTTLDQNAGMLFKATVTEEKNSNTIDLNQYRYTRNIALVNGNGSLGSADQSELQKQADAINFTMPASFDAHIANFYQQFPSATAFQQVDMAAAIAPGRVELIAPELVNSARKDDATEMVRWSKAMKQRGQVAPGLYKMAEDVLLSVEKDGILIAAGEMDTYPLWVEQYANAKRGDVLVVDHRMLGDPTYRARIWARAKARGAVPANAGELIQKLPGVTDRPVFLSLALGQRMANENKAKLYVTGLAMQLSEHPLDNIPLLEERWKRMNKAMDTGPLARNYLVPGSILLKHYRDTGNEASASKLEHELRGMAERTGAMRLMFESKTFTH